MKLKKRQVVRKTIIFISFLTFPVVMFYFSPVVIIQGAYKGIVVGSFITFVSMFVASLFIGRAICGWYCPAAGLQECAQYAKNKPARNGNVNLIKFFIWVPWLSSIIILFILAGGFHSIDFFYSTNKGISISAPFTYIIYYGFVGLMVLLSYTAGRRGFCHYVCWMAPFMIIGSKIRNIIKIPSLRLKVQNENCINCTLCNKVCQMSLDVNKMVGNGSIEDSECILCGECVDVCPRKVIKYSL